MHGIDALYDFGNDTWRLRQKNESSGKIEIELVQYKPEAVKTFEKIEEEFNATHDDIHLTIESPNDAMTVLKTRFIREDAPDIIGIGGDVNFSNFIDSDMLMDISDYEGLDSIKQAYLDIDKALEFVPEDGVYAVPYVANAAGVLYNRAMFKEYGWEIPETWDEFIASVNRSRVKESSHCILDLKIHGLVLHRGMRSPLILHRQMSAVR